MKTINEMTMNELAEYVVTLDGWEWMPGILIAATEKKRAWRVLIPITGSDETRPDLNDPATLGCVLEMCRKRISQWFYVEPVRGAGGYVGKVPFLGAPPVTDDMPTEAHALAAALAKEAS